MVHTATLSLRTHIVWLPWRRLNVSVQSVMRSWVIQLAMKYVHHLMYCYRGYHPTPPQVDVGYCIPTNSGRVMFCTNEVLLAKIRLNPLLMGKLTCCIMDVEWMLMKTCEPNCTILVKALYESFNGNDNLAMVTQIYKTCNNLLLTLWVVKILCFCKLQASDRWWSTKHVVTF